MTPKVKDTVMTLFQEKVVAESLASTGYLISLVFI